MSVPDQTPYIIHNANGLTTVFAFEFYIIANSDLRVAINGTDVTGGFTVSGAGNIRGGEVTFLTPPVAGAAILLERNVPTRRMTEYQDNGDLLASTVNKDFDRLWMAMQQAFVSLGLALTRPLFGGPFNATGYRISNVGAPKDAGDAVNLQYLKDVAGALEKRSLRVSDMDIPALPPAYERADKILTFDRNGVPKVVAPASGSAVDVLNQLSSENGALLVSGTTFECDTVNKAITVKCLEEGRKVRTYHYAVDVVSDWVFTKEKPASNVFYIDAIGGYLILLTPNFASAGIRLGEYNPVDAWHNRNVITRLLRDTRFNAFNFGCVGQFYILGTVAPNRDDITVMIDEGCNVIGRYDDPSIPDSTRFQTGEMFGFPIRAGYDSGNFTVTADVNNVHLVINGSISTEYNTQHSNKNNNNTVGFLRSNNCTVKGGGGVLASDHKGICFDGDAVNCHIDLGYILNTKNEPYQMKGKNTSGIRNKCTTRVGRIETAFGGTNPRVAAYVSGCSHDVTIDKFDYFGEAGLPVLVGAFGAKTVNIFIGEIGGVSQVGRMSNTNEINVVGGVVYKTLAIIIRAGADSNTARKVTIRGLTAKDNVLVNGYAEESVVVDAINQVIIEGCDLFPASTSFKYINAVRDPLLKSIFNNISRRGMDIVEYNPILGVASRNVITEGTRAFTYDAGLPDFTYSSINLLIKNASGATYSIDINIKARRDSAVEGATFNVGGVVIDTVLRGLRMTISTETAGAFFVACTPFN